MFVVPEAFLLPQYSSIMPATEVTVGILETLGSHSPFRAVVKQTVDDFIVSEILKDGSVATLTCLPASRGRRRPHTDDAAQIVDLNDAIIPTDSEFAALDALFVKDVANKASDEMRKLFPNSGSQETPSKSIILPPCSDKAVRTSVHEWISSHMPSFISDTVDTSDGRAIRVCHARNVRPSKRRRSDRERLAAIRPSEVSQPTGGASKIITPGADNDVCKEKGSESLPLRVSRGTPVQFVLWKRGLDTNHALSMLGKCLRVPVSAFSYAGTKDKRGVTTQLVQVRGVQEASFAHANRVLGPRNGGKRTFAVGNLKISNRPALRLGDLIGNRFTVILRDIDLLHPGAETNVRNAVDSIKSRGFINYFGLQRFGSGVSPTHETGFAVMRGDFQDVCRRLLLPLVVDCVVEELRTERLEMQTALDKFGRGEISASDLVTALPRRMTVERTIAEAFAHNERNNQKHDHRAAFGQLPRNLRRIYGHAVQSYLWNMMASERIRLHKPDIDTRMHAIAGDLVVDCVLAQHEWEEFSYDTKVRVVSPEEEESRRVSVYDVVIPVVGSEVPIPKSKYGAVAQKILEEQKIDIENQVVSEYGMKGTYRKLLARPRNVEMKFTSYKDNNVALVPSCLELVNFDNSGNSSEHCDKGRIEKGEDTEVVVENSVDTKGEEARSVVNGEAQTEGESKMKTAMVLSFSLGCAEYATMLVRELTKYDSSTAGQKALQLEADAADE